MLLPLATALVLAPALARSAPLEGDHRVNARTRVKTSELDHEYRSDATVSLAPQAGGSWKVVVSAQGKHCEFAPTKPDLEGSLVLEPGQRCALEEESDTVRARLNAILSAGTISFRGKQILVRLAWNVDGTVQLRSRPVHLDLPTGNFDLPATWLPALPVRGTVSSEGESSRGCAEKSAACQPE